MSEMFNNNVSNNGVNEAKIYNIGLSHARCLVVRTHDSGRHQDTVQRKWSTQNNTYVMRYYYQSQPGLTRHKQSLHTFWKEIGLFQAGKQRLCDQVRMIKNKY